MSANPKANALVNTDPPCVSVKATADAPTNTNVKVPKNSASRAFHRLSAMLVCIYINLIIKLFFFIIIFVIIFCIINIYIKYTLLLFFSMCLIEVIIFIVYF